MCQESCLCILSGHAVVQNKIPVVDRSTTGQGGDLVIFISRYIQLVRAAKHAGKGDTRFHIHLYGNTFPVNVGLYIQAENQGVFRKGLYFPLAVSGIAPYFFYLSGPRLVRNHGRPARTRRLVPRPNDQRHHKPVVTVNL